MLESESVSHSVISTLCNPMDCSPPGSSAHGISQARILAWVGISFSRRFPGPMNRTHISCTGRQILYYPSHQESPIVIYTLQENIHKKAL